MTQNETLVAEQKKLEEEFERQQASKRLERVKIVPIKSL